MTFEEYRKLCERRKELTLIRSYSVRNEMMEINKKINRVNNGLYMPSIDVEELITAVYNWCKANNIQVYFSLTEANFNTNYNNIKIFTPERGKLYRVDFDAKTKKVETEFLKQAFLNPPEITKMVYDYPGLVEVIWSLVKKELQKEKTEQISLIDKLIEETKQERQTYLDKDLRQAKIDSLSCDIANQKLKRKEIEDSLEDF